MEKCNDFRFFPHVLKRSDKREVNLDYIEKCLLNLLPLGVNKSRENRFKLIYPHETKSSEDLYIIIEIDDYQEIEVVTIYTYSINRRLREYAI